jgi:hypothetical protein
MHPKTLLRFALSCASALVLLCAFTAAGQKSRPDEDRARDYYTRWLDGDVFWIVSDEERDVFAKLGSDEERDAFIEQFWARREAGLRHMSGLKPVPTCSLLLILPCGSGL